MPNPRANRSRSDAPRQLLLSASAPAPQRRWHFVSRSCSAAMPAHCRRPRSTAAPVPCRKRAAAPWLRIGGALTAPLLCSSVPAGQQPHRRPSRQSSVPMVPGQQQLRHNVPASSPLCRRFPCQQQLRQGCASHQAIRHGTPASNKPNSAEKSTAVWLAIWRIWAGFANSQLWRATFRSTYLYICPSALLPL